MKNITKEFNWVMENLASREADILAQININQMRHGNKTKAEVILWLQNLDRLRIESDDFAQKVAESCMKQFLGRSRLRLFLREAKQLLDQRLPQELALNVDKTGYGLDYVPDGDRARWGNPLQLEATEGFGLTGPQQVMDRFGTRSEGSVPNLSSDVPSVRSVVHFFSPNGSFRRRITFWKRGKFLGRGSYGTVYEGITDDGFAFAVKEVQLLDPGHVAQLEKEICLLSQFEHENIVRYLGTDKDDEKLYIFLELVTKGSLSKLYHEHALGDSQVSAYTRQILLGVEYLHGKGVIHRDIKCANVLVDANGSVKLADFGLAKDTKSSNAKTFVGNILWMAPEVFRSRNEICYGLKADIWSLGCTVLEMSTGQSPYSRLALFDAVDSIRKGELPEIPMSLSEDARDFILQCLQFDVDRRPTAAELRNHSFVRERYCS